MNDVNGDLYLPWQDNIWRALAEVRCRDVCSFLPSQMVLNGLLIARQRQRGTIVKQLWRAPDFRYRERLLSMGGRGRDQCYETLQLKDKSIACAHVAAERKDATQFVPQFINGDGRMTAWLHPRRLINRTPKCPFNFFDNCARGWICSDNDVYLDVRGGAGRFGQVWNHATYHLAGD